MIIDAIENGAKYFLHKPYDKNEFEDVIKRVEASLYSVV
jgi:FixJ family two-component response regulator